MKAGWEQKRLGEVCSLINRGVAPKYIESGGVTVLNQKCVRDHEVTFELGRRHDVNAKKVDPDRYVRVGDVLVNSTGTGTLGRVAQIRVAPPEPTTVDTHVTIVRPEAGRFYPDFFGYMLIQVEDEIANSGEGASGQTELARSTLQNKFTVSFPTSLLEQQRIVAILDEALAGLVTATANAEKNLKNARELFESSLSGAFTKISEGHDTVRLSDIVTRLTNGYVGPTRDIYLDSGVPYLLARHVHDNHLEFDGRTFVSKEFNEKHKKSKLKKDDVLLVQSGHIGHSAVVGQDHEGHNCHAMIVISPVVGRLSGEFLSFYFGSSLMKRKFEEIRSGSTVPHLTCGLVKELMIPLPSIEAQHSLVAEFKKIEQETDRLALLAIEKLFALGQLKQSVLQKAFSGELAVVPSVAKTDFADTRIASFTASVLALAYERHRLAGRERTFGHKKAQKLLHLVEAAGNVDLGRDPIKDAAGPNDFGHMLRATAWAEQQQIFRVKKSENRYFFERLPNYKRGLEEAKRATQQYSKEIDQITDFLLPMNSDEAEIIATVYAAWNNLIIKSKPVDDEAIVREAREDWHLDKMNIPRHRFFDAIELLKNKKLVPKGRAKLVREKYLI